MQQWAEKCLLEFSASGPIWADDVHRLEEFDASTHGGLVLYGFAALSAAASIVWFLKYSDTESSLALGLGLLSTFHVCMLIACLMISMIPGVVGHGLLFAAFVFLFVNRSKCLRVAEE